MSNTFLQEENECKEAGAEKQVQTAACMEQQRAAASCHWYSAEIMSNQPRICAREGSQAAPTLTSAVHDHA
jgi:hypothetical protein